MHFRHALLALLIVVCCADIVLGRESPREKRVASAAPAPASASVSKANDPQPKKTDSKITAVGGANTRATKTSQTITTKAKDNKASTNTALIPGNANGKADSEDEELPIQPSITPAVGIAGVLLILTGAAYTLIGIKHEWLLVFLSTAYLASLGVTVLIIYVMNPPVSNGIQVAYFFAAFLTGLLFGGLSLIFREVAKGFACIVGGFCLSMWFLCLKPGGLITSTTGKAIMILVFCAVGWSLAFTKYTRNYGTIFCSSFGGAMITIIGIDCFTRAGLKEFWIYIWALNDNEFPLHTRTYPITRAMRAELACTVVLCAIGLVSQVKVWKIVKERRARKEGERLEDETSRENRDSKFGRAVEARNSKSLAAWEAVYGEKNVDSEVGTSISSLKKSANVSAREIDDVELEELNTGTEERSNREGLGRPGEKDVEVSGTAPKSHPDSGAAEGYYTSELSPRKSSDPSPSQSAKGSIDFAEPPIPPLPFSLLTANLGGTTHDGESNYSAATRAQETQTGVPNEMHQSRREEESPFDLEPIEDDRASSVAATLDEDPDFDALSVKRLSRFSLAPSLINIKAPPASEGVPRMPGEEPVEDHDEEELVKPISSADEPNSESRTDKFIPAQKDEIPAPVPISETNLPTAISKVAHVYRTNEWAKHVAEADEPEPINDALDSDEPAVHIDVGRPQETPRPLDVRELSPEQMQPQLFRSVSNAIPTQSRESIRQSTSSAAYALQRQSSNTSVNQPRPDKRGTGSAQIPPTLLESNGSPYSPSSGTPVYAFNHQNSTSSLNQAKREIRKTAPSPVPPTLVESPGEETFAAAGTLLDERNLRLQNRPVTTNFNGLPSPRPVTQPALDSTNVPNSAEDIPLSVRRSLLAQNAPAAADQRRTSSTNLLRSTSAQSSYPALPSRFSSTTTLQKSQRPPHQIQRFSSVNQSKQNAMLAQWRQSLQQEVYSPQSGFATGQPLLQPQQQQQQPQQHVRAEAMESKAEMSAPVTAMTTSDLMERHRSVMRKMQARANEADKPSATAG